ncbi:lipoprotein [Deinococcus fonticola]|uniref:lipoprotein n=1 Tax=Deinococcus fonticola TaxID=2528713 RepID=UPI0010750631|nr:lipoprotein [Deinococcus fonticola]
MKKSLFLASIVLLLTGCAENNAPTAKPEISLSAERVTVVSGASEVTTEINLTRRNGHTEAVTLSVSGMPQGMSAVFEKSVLSASETVAKLQLKAINVPSQLYKLTVTADSPSAKTSTTLEVIVNIAD